MYQKKYIWQAEERKHFKMYKSGKNWLTVGIGVTIFSAGLLATNTQVKAADTQTVTAVTTESVKQSTSSNANSYQLSGTTTTSQTDTSMANDAKSAVSQSQSTVTDSSATTTQTKTSTGSASISGTASTASSTVDNNNVTTSSNSSTGIKSDVASTASIATSTSAATGSTQTSSLVSQWTTTTSSQEVTNQSATPAANNNAVAGTVSSQAAPATSLTDIDEIHTQESDQFIAGSHSNTDTESQVPSIGSINSYVNANGENQIDIPAGLSADILDQWIENAKQQATLDWQTTGRVQVITTKDASVDSWTIGDSSRPTVDAVDISSYQSNMTQANFNKLKQLGVKTVIVKLTENTNYTNPYASSQIKMARAADLTVEVYHYAKFATTSAAAAEANHLASVMRSLGLSSNTLVFADMEDTSTYSASIIANLNKFWSMLSNCGYTNHGVYTYVSYKYRDAVVGTVGASRTWMAQYPYSPSASSLWNTNYGAWQFSSTAYLPGYSGALDVSIDYKSLVVPISNENKGNFDHVTINNNILHIDGWQAADSSKGKTNSYIILYDKTSNKELGRYKITRITRPDVAKAYPNIYNSAKSGFSIDIPITFSLAGHDIYVISRYSDATNGEGSHVDLWSKSYQFNVNAGYFESLTISNNILHIKGWHAADASYGKKYSYIILYDKANNKELGRYKITRTTRTDVGKIYRGTYDALQSGYSIDIPITFSLAGREIYVISRYSNDATHGEGSHVDLWSSAYKFNENAGFTDHVSISSNTIHIDGWSAADASYGKKYSFLFLMDANGREISRYRIDRISRSDVAKVYKSLYGADKSGFSINIPITAKLRGEKFSIMVRYTSDPAGNKNYVDTWLSGSHTVPNKNIAILDKVTSNGKIINIDGWHAADASVEEPYRYIFLIDNATGLEVQRYRISNIPRNDVAAAYPNVLNASQSGFSISIPITVKIKNKNLRIMVRYSNNPSGNGLTTDYWFASVIKLPFQTI